MAAVAIVEMRRLDVSRHYRGNSVTLPISAFYLFPQFILVGIGKAFMYIDQLDFFITQSTKAMKAISIGLFLTTNAISFFGSTILITIVKKVIGEKFGHAWLAPRINDSRLDCFYALLAVLCSINLGFYLVCSMWYKPNPVDNAQRINSGVDDEKDLNAIDETITILLLCGGNATFSYVFMESLL